MILKHRDRELLRFEWAEPQGVRILSVDESAQRLLPLEMCGLATDEALWSWISHRVVPRGRKFIQATLVKMGINPRDTRRIVEFSRGLSLNDVYWMVAEDFDGSWADYNLYTNEFSTDIATLALTGLGCPTFEKHASTPELTTNGMLKKCWRRTKDGILLFKGGSEGALNAGFEPYSEFYAAQVAAALGFDHVTYGLSRDKGVVYSTCPLFTSERFSYLPASRAPQEMKAEKDPRFASVFLFDAIVFNTDRHLGNFGYLVDNETNEIIGAAPIFDNGYGLFSLATWCPERPQYHDFANLSAYAQHLTPALYPSWLDLPCGWPKHLISRLDALRGFRFKRHHYYNMPAERLSAIEAFLSRRASDILEYGAKANDFISLSIPNEGINSIEPSSDEGKRRLRGDSLILQIKENLQVDPCITNAELAQLLGVSVATIERKIKSLRESGEIRRVGSRKMGHWDLEPSKPS